MYIHPIISTPPYLKSLLLFYSLLLSFYKKLTAHNDGYNTMEIYSICFELFLLVPVWIAEQETTYR